MTIFNSNLQNSLILAGSLSLLSSTARAQQAPTEQPLLQGRAGIATMCIETRSYVDVETNKIVTPEIYIKSMPKEGIDTKYVEGNAVSGLWKSFLKPADAKKKTWLDDTDIPDQAEEAIKLVNRLDKDKNGIVTVEEFEKGEKGKSEEDRDTDMAFLTSLACDSLYLTEGALNTVDPEKFPIVIQLKSDLEKSKATIESIGKERDDYKNKFYGAAVLSGLLAVGLIVSSVRNRKKPETTPPAPQTGAQVHPDGAVAAIPTPDPAAAPAAAPAASATGGFDDLLAGLGTPPPPPAADPAAAAPAATPPAGGPPPLPGSGGTGSI